MIEAVEQAADGTLGNGLGEGGTLLNQTLKRAIGGWQECGGVQGTERALGRRRLFVGWRTRQRRVDGDDLGTAGRADLDPGALDGRDPQGRESYEEMRKKRENRAQARGRAVTNGEQSTTVLHRLDARAATRAFWLAANRMRAFRDSIVLTGRDTRCMPVSRGALLLYNELV